MGLVYLFALVVGMGTLVVQIAMGAKGEAAGDADAGHDGGAGHHEGSVGEKAIGKHVGDDGGFTALILSTRFWIYALLAFGMSGSLIHLFGFAGSIATFVIAALAGVASGLFAVMVFRAVKRASSAGVTKDAGQAVGQVGRVIVTCARGRKGQVRIELGGHSVDLLATTDEDEIRRGEAILVEDVRGSVAHISRRPPELA